MGADTLRKWVYAGQADKACDSSERRAVFDFLADIIDNVDYDLKCGNCVGENVLHQQLRGSLEQLIEQAQNILTEMPSE